MSKPALAKALRGATEHLNLPIPVKRVSRSEPRTARWQRDLGVTLMTLDGFRLPEQETA